MATKSPMSLGLADGVSEIIELGDVMDISISSTEEYPDPDSVFFRDSYGDIRKLKSEQSISDSLIDAFALESDNKYTDNNIGDRLALKEYSSSAKNTDATENNTGDDHMTGIEFTDIEMPNGLAKDTEDADSKNSTPEFVPWRKGPYSWIDRVYFYTTEEEWRDASVRPPMIGIHVMQEWRYGRQLKKRETPFIEFDPVYFLSEPLREREVSEMKEYGIKVSHASVTLGEWELLDDEKLNAYRCVPSGLRKVWSVD